MIFGRQPKETPDELANRLQREGRADQLERELQRYNPDRLGPKDKANFYHLWGIAAFRRGDRTTAFERFKQGLEKCPDSAEIRFSLGQEHEARREIEQMFACFDRCVFPKVPSSYVLAAARYAYLWGDAERGAQYLAPIAEAYFQLGIADDHFVYVRGLPFFGQTWSYLVAFAWMARSYGPVDDLLERCKSKLSDYDFDRLGLLYDCHKRSDYMAYVERLTQRLHGLDPRFPSGYERTQLVALRATKSSDTASAIAELESIALAENDFPWLRDIALVHKARLYWKTGSEDEAVTRSQFMSKQRMLFEPDHAYAFGFLDYQERLRPLYQKIDRK
jgi:tetratricopeptide (TPR) repeat protein